MCFRLLLPPFVIIFAAEIWRKDQEILFLFGILQFKKIWIDSELGAISKNWN